MDSQSRDLVANRGRLELRHKLRLLWISVRQNGPAWSTLLAAYYAASAASEALFATLQRMKLARGLPGTSAPEMNREIWDHWDWGAGGEEWSLSPEWKQSLIENILLKYIPAGSSVLEIGPGAGRWTEALLGLAAQLTAIDISDKCVALCRQRFASWPQASFLLGNGRDLTGVPEASVDAIWAFDVFVHINVAEAAAYVKDFCRVMRPGGVGVIHHGSRGGIDGGWRSNLTAADFRQILEGAGFVVEAQIQGWEDQRTGRQFPVGLYGDTLTIFRLGLSGSAV